jgi:hypothetical protein
MSTMANPNNTQQWQDSTSISNPNEIKERKAPLNSETRAQSPAHTNRSTNPQQREQIDNNGTNGNKKMLSPRAPNSTPQTRTNTEGAPRNRVNESSGKSFYKKMEFLDTLIHDMDDDVSIL